MKKWITAWLVLLLMIVASQIGFATEAEDDFRAAFEVNAITDDLRLAFVLTAQQQVAHSNGNELDFSRAEHLSKIQGQVKGLKVVFIGNPTCKPCQYLFEALTSSSEQDCLLDQWESKQIGFYMINTHQEYQPIQNDENLFYLWKIKSIPVLLLVKDGIPVARLNGYHESKSKEILAILNSEVKRWR